ncbi:helix-turn-helix domain-containing protein [Haloplanus halophilus]|uniref:helix-turn-helix domain-containing protein n=1 Tax=Haloplanus halophilus TaxID=2949993 RepID=UPI0020418D08|nr:helix-turn-helix domain-containing protein [Haloplanus sp. GDY1]
MSDTERPSDPRNPVEVRFSVSDPAYPFVGITREEDCRVELERMLPRGSGTYAEFFSVIGADADRVLELARSNDLVEASLLSRYESGGLFEFLVSGFCPARRLAELGAIPQAVVSEDGEGRIAADVPADRDAAEVVDDFLDDHPSAELIAKRTKESSAPLFTTEELRMAVDDRLTDRQREILFAAYEAGHYERPRETTCEELADEFDISPATLSQHLRVAERKLVTVFAEDSTAPSSA